MNRGVWWSIIAVSTALSALAQTSNSPPRVTIPIVGDLGKVKIEAERGNPAAQVALGNAYNEHFLPDEALKWYRAAAEQNSPMGKYHLGHLLLWGAMGKAIPPEHHVPPQPAQGIQWMYSAATNGQKEAWLEMAQAKQAGAGCETNLAEAYAWLLVAGADGNFSGERLVLRMSGSQIAEGKALSRDMNQKNWPTLKPTKEAPIANKNLPIVPLKLNGLSAGGPVRLAIINGKTVAETEKLTVRAGKETLSVTCLKINDDSVSVQVEGEAEPRVLQLK